MGEKTLQELMADAQASWDVYQAAIEAKRQMIEGELTKAITAGAGLPEGWMGEVGTANIYVAMKQLVTSILNYLAMGKSP